MRFKNSVCIAVMAILLMSAGLLAAEHDQGHWESYGVKGKISDDLSYSSSVELRLKDNTSDFHYFKWDTGLKYQLNKVVGLGASYRHNPSEKNNDWSTGHYLLLDQSIKIFKVGNWGMDYRNRFNIRLGDQGRGFWRAQVTAAYGFKLNNRKASWFVSNESWYQISDINGRDRYNINWATSGIKFYLNRFLEFSPYYRLRSDKAKDNSSWKHTHVLGSSLNFVF